MEEEKKPRSKKLGPRAQQNKRFLLPCRKCEEMNAPKIRRARYGGKTGGEILCEACWRITGVEGTRQKYGCKPPAKPGDFAATIRTINKMRLEGKFAYEIAKVFGKQSNWVVFTLATARKQGFVIEPAPTRILPGTRKFKEKGRVPHGGGKAGRVKCSCEPCVSKYREYVRSKNVPSYARKKRNRKKDGNESP